MNFEVKRTEGSKQHNKKREEGIKSDNVMPKLVNRAPQTPRKIRDIRPKRQLARNSEKKEEQHDDDWWYRAKNDGGVGQAHLRGVPAANRSVKSSSDSNAPRSATESITHGDGNVPRNGIFCICHTAGRLLVALFCVCNALVQIYRKIKQVSPQKRRKRFFWALVIFAVWRIIYSVDLDRYSLPGLNGSAKSIRSTNSEYSSLKEESDDALMFGDIRPQINVVSRYADTRLRGSEAPPNAMNMLKQAGTGTKSMSRPDTDSFSPQKPLRSMAESVGMRSDVFVFHGDSKEEKKKSEQSPRSMAESGGIRSDVFAFLGSSNEETKTSGKYPMTWTNPQTQNSLANDRSQQNLHGSSQHTLGNGHDSIGFNVPLKYDHFDANRNTNDLPSESKLSGLEAVIPSPNPPKDLNADQNNPNRIKNSSPQKVASGTAIGLDCSVYGGPFDQSEYADIVYWRDITADASFTSPYYNQQAQESISGSFWKAKYLTFEMDVSNLMQIQPSRTFVVCLFSSRRQMIFL